MPLLIYRGFNHLLYLSQFLRTKNRGTQNQTFLPLTSQYRKQNNPVTISGQHKRVPNNARLVSDQASYLASRSFGPCYAFPLTTNMKITCELAQVYLRHLLWTLCVGICLRCLQQLLSNNALTTTSSAAFEKIGILRWTCAQQV